MLCREAAVGAAGAAGCILVHRVEDHGYRNVDGLLSVRAVVDSLRHHMILDAFQIQETVKVLARHGHKLEITIGLPSK
jgi:hypothetical protein